MSGNSSDASGSLPGATAQSEQGFGFDNVANKV